MVARMRMFSELGENFIHASKGIVHFNLLLKEICTVSLYEVSSCSSLASLSLVGETVRHKLTSKHHLNASSKQIYMVCYFLFIVGE